MVNLTDTVAFAGNFLDESNFEAPKMIKNAGEGVPWQRLCLLSLWVVIAARAKFGAIEIS